MYNYGTYRWNRVKEVFIYNRGDLQIYQSKLHFAYHLPGNEAVIACGSNHSPIDHMALDGNREAVNCLRCQKTKAFRELKGVMT